MELVACHFFRSYSAWLFGLQITEMNNTVDCLIGPMVKAHRPNLVAFLVQIDATTVLLVGYERRFAFKINLSLGHFIDRDTIASFESFFFDH